ncbi:unnamed protein product [Prorocentrum cordatum]|uniref:Uncharacterized protein n=1 Tax=Prorocentrum cordatum TaxID=2364126 RepID=A0ABN9X3Z0_9DINO|nr:unnamed protein product [Polarella glacialis]
MAFDFVCQAPVGHTLAFEIPSGTEIVFEVLQSQEMPASLERRLEAPLLQVSFATRMDGALPEKGSRRRRRGRAMCRGGQIGSMAGGAAAVGLGFLTCAFLFS